MEWTSESALSAASNSALANLSITRKERVEHIVLATFVAFLARWADRGEVRVATTFFSSGRGFPGKVDLDLPTDVSIQAILKFLEEAPHAQSGERKPTMRLSCDRQSKGEVSIAFGWSSDPSPLSLKKMFPEADLVLLCRWVADRLVITWGFNPKLLESSMIGRRQKNFEALLDSSLIEPDTAIRRLAILGPGERDLLQGLLCGPTTPEPNYRRTVQELVEEQVRRMPDAPAIETPKERLTYAELDGKANALARRLLSGGLRTGDTVAIMTARSPSLIIGVLGALKAGGCFLVLNHCHPAERVATLIDEAEARFVVVDSATRGSELPPDVAKVIADGSARCDRHRLPLKSGPQDVAYIVFTSGSMGRPKGVMVSHQAIVNQLLARRDTLNLQADDRVLQSAAPSFDVAIWEFIGPLVFGGCIVMSGSGDFDWDPTRLWKTICELEVTVIQIVPSQLALLLDVMGDRCPSKLRHVICGGERMPQSIVTRFCALGVGRLYNFYGPAEGAIDSTWWPCEPESEARAAPIGRAIPNRHLHVVDSDGQQVPMGFSGELIVGGVGIAEGYLNRPDLTSERFLSDPFTDNPTARVYRTGDRVRLRESGELEFLGRMDRQIKLRGVRIEPGEIEIAIAGHPDVTACVVAVQPAKSGDDCVVAYCAADEAKCSVQDIRLHARRLLPAELVPSAFVILRDMPKTASGKVDPGNLPSVDWDAIMDDGAGRLRTPAEHEVAAIWSEVLGISITDPGVNFFEIGGHSLAAVKVLSRIAEGSGVEISVREFFQAPILRDLARRAALAPGTATVGSDTNDADLPLFAPLSFNQEGLWFLDRLGDGGAYNEFEGIRIRGRLDVQALHAALEGVHRRHDILRTVLVEEAGAVLQSTKRSVSVDFSIVDLSDLLPAERERRWQELARREARAPFNLTVGPLARFALVKLGHEEHVFLVSIHHICGDGWSLQILAREVERLYAAHEAGRPPDLQLPAKQYGDFARRQRQDMSGHRLEQGIRWWTRHLEGLPPLLALPLDRPRAACQSFEGERRAFDLGPRLTRKVRELSRRQHVTPFVAALAAFAILLQRYTRTDDIPIGTPFANRRDQEDIFGYLANSVVLRVNLGGDVSVGELLDRVMTTVTDAHEHAAIPFSKIVEALQPPRDLSYHPVFQIMFSWQVGDTLANLRLPSTKVTPLGLYGGRTKFDINVVTRDVGGESISGWWEYSTDLFDSSTIAQMADHYLLLLEQMAEDAARPVRRLGLLSEYERREIAMRWAVKADFPVACTLVDLFTEQVKRRPDSVAVVSTEQVLTYGELNDRADALASHLSALGAVRGSLVGVLVERSADFAIAVLGVLKSGAAYVPLDPSYPASRVAAIASDADFVAVVVHQNFLDRLPSTVGHVVVLDRDREAIPAGPYTGTPAKPDDVAYVIFTSGSTGTPKGVQIEHRNVVRLFAATDQWFGFGPQDAWSVFHSAAFDFSVWELWGALLHGGRAVIVPYTVSRSPDEFYQFLVTQRITVLNQTPSAFLQLSRAEAASGVDPKLALRYIIFGGEALDFATLSPWFERHGDARPQLVNMYGITETTVHVTYRPLTLADASANGKSLIGRPIPDLGLAIFDDMMRVCPTRVPGELYVYGAGVSRGYLKRPELTAARFVDHPSEPGRRMYRTGDLVRSLDNGDIEYLGRIDHQIQLRGFRIELGEIEAVLGEYPGVIGSLATIREDSPGGKRLVAYFVTGTKSPPRDALREHLRSRLPSYMVPSAIVRLERFPLTSNGKIDRRALPRPEYGTSFGIEPRSTTEASLLKLWKTLLGTNDIGVRDNFFEIGGHSLLAATLLSRVATHLGRSVALAAFLADPTIEGLATAMTSADRRRARFVRLNSVVGGAPFFCFAGAGGMIQALTPLAKRVRAFPVAAIARSGLDDDGAPLRSVEAMASEAVEAIREIQPSGPVFLGGHSFGGWIAHAAAMRLTAEGRQVARLFVLDMPAPPSVPTRLVPDSERLEQRLAEIVKAVYGQVDEDVAQNGPTLSGVDIARDTLIRTGAKPAEECLGYVGKMLAVLAADEEAEASYRASTASDFPITLFRSSKRWDEAGGPMADTNVPCLGWTRLTRDAVEVVSVGGDHTSMLAEPHAGTISKRIDAVTAAEDYA